MEKLKKDIEKIVNDLDYYIYDIEYVKEKNDYVLRIMIENEGVITIDDCIKTSKKVGEFLDINDPITDPYNLEVTSPGAERVLKTDNHIKRAIGKHVHIETVEQKFQGQLMSYKDGFFEVKQNNKRITKINEIDVNLIRLAIKF
jgi:ribosome maturation factor RimP